MYYSEQDNFAIKDIFGNYDENYIGIEDQMEIMYQ